MALKTYRREYFPFPLTLQFPAGPRGPAVCPLAALRVLPVTLPLSDPRPLSGLIASPAKFCSFLVQPVFPNFACISRPLGQLLKPPSPGGPP